MRARAEIEKSSGQGTTSMEQRTLEVLLDIRELLQERPQPSLGGASTDLGGPLRPAEIEKVVAKLREVAKFMSTGLSREVWVEFSFLDGSRSVYEFRVKGALPLREHVLFRAIVGAAGLPVVLDLFEDNKPVCNTLEAISLHMIAFLAHPDVQRMIVSTRG